MSGIITVMILFLDRQVLAKSEDPDQNAPDSYDNFLGCPNFLNFHSKWYWSCLLTFSTL